MFSRSLIAALIAGGTIWLAVNRLALIAAAPEIQPTTAPTSPPSCTIAAAEAEKEPIPLARYLVFVGQDPLNPETRGAAYTFHAGDLNRSYIARQIPIMRSELQSSAWRS